MAYNKTSEERKWNYWKEQEEKKLRELGMEEEKIQKLRQKIGENNNRESFENGFLEELSGLVSTHWCQALLNFYKHINSL